MIQIAFIDSNGEISTILSPAYDQMYQDGQQYGDYLVKHISVEENGIEFISTKYYDSTNDVFKTRIGKPSDYHKWNKIEEDWYFDITAALAYIRRERNFRLSLCDWTQIVDAQLTEAVKLEWQTYRQQLRDLPSTLPEDMMSIAEVSWPTPPS